MLKILNKILSELNYRTVENLENLEGDQKKIFDILQVLKSNISKSIPNSDNHPEILEPVLVYGTCLRFKANIKHPKFRYWNAMYSDGIECLTKEASDNYVSE